MMDSACNKGAPRGPARPAAHGLLSAESPERGGGEGRRNVKKHHHKHNLKHRYELQETLGRGTYGKVRKATERSSGREVRENPPSSMCQPSGPILDREDKSFKLTALGMNGPLHQRRTRTRPNLGCNYGDRSELETVSSELETVSSELETVSSELETVSSELETVSSELETVSSELETVAIKSIRKEKIREEQDMIADFGLSNLFHKDKLLQTFCGSPLYASPEIVNGKPYHGPEVDSWALGVLLYTLVYGAMPFDGGNHKNLIRQINARGLIRWMLMVNPERRATVEDIANHWWVNWGWKNSVCDCETQRDHGGPPVLARLIDWQSRSDKPTAAVPTATAPPLLRQRPKKSKKENSPDAGPEDKPGLKRPKGILKTRLTGEPRTPSPDRTEAAPLRPSDSSPTQKSVLPKKGILKNNQQQRESGYYSSPERSESSDLLAGAAAMSLLLAAGTSPPRRAAGRKGILKHNGKYSTFSGAPQSRPSSIVGEDGPAALSLSPGAPGGA
ncbi:hypothetical protein NHX12_002568, partial [Muraenolepis orangiensis]